MGYSPSNTMGYSPSNTLRMKTAQRRKGRSFEAVAVALLCCCLAFYVYLVNHLSNLQFTSNQPGARYGQNTISKNCGDLVDQDRPNATPQEAAPADQDHPKVNDLSSNLPKRLEAAPADQDHPTTSNLPKRQEAAPADQDHPKDIGLSSNLPNRPEAAPADQDHPKDIGLTSSLPKRQEAAPADQDHPKDNSLSSSLPNRQEAAPADQDHPKVNDLSSSLPNAQAATAIQEKKQTNDPATYALPLEENDFIQINSASCHGVRVPGTLQKPRVLESVFYMAAKFRVGGERWNDGLQNLGCRVKMSSAIPEDNIFIFRDEFPTPLLHHPGYERHRQFLQNETDTSGRGAGYWFWKPLVVLSVLQDDHVPFGSYIIYTDGDRPDVIGYVSNVVETMEQRGHDFCVQQWRGGPESHYTKGDIYDHFGVYGRWSENDKPQYSASFFVLKKSPTTIEFVLKWANLMENYNLVSDETSRLANPPHFDENRHAQSMLSMLLKLVYGDGGPTKTAVELDMNNGYVEPHKWFVSKLDTFSYRLEQSRTSNVADAQKAAPAQQDHHKVAGLSCDKYGGPGEAAAAEMVYWRDIPSDALVESPFKNVGPKLKYLTVEPDEGGLNNIRMSVETAVTMAMVMGRVLVLPPSYHMHKVKDKTFTFKDFYHFDSVELEHPGLNILTFEEFLKREAMTGHMIDPTTGKPSFPPNNKTNWDGLERKGNVVFPWLRKVTKKVDWNYNGCLAAFPSEPGEAAVQRLQDAMAQVNAQIQGQSPTDRIQTYINNPTPVDAPSTERIKEMLAARTTLCIYDTTFQNAKFLHLMGDNDSGARMLNHFYAFEFFEDWKVDQWAKRFVRDHLRYIDEIQCAAARHVQFLQSKAKEFGDPQGNFYTMHIRRDDFLTFYKSTRMEADEMYQIAKDLIPPNSVLYIATDEKSKSFFDIFIKNYRVYFFDSNPDFVKGTDANFYGMVEQLIAAKGKVFFGTYYSTFTGYINRVRGYHSLKDKTVGYEKGALESYYFVPRDFKNAVHEYQPVQFPYWAREFPIGWRDIDKSLGSS